MCLLKSLLCVSDPPAICLRAPDAEREGQDVGREKVSPMCHTKFLYARHVVTIVRMHNIHLPSLRDGSPLSAGSFLCRFSDNNIVTISNECHDLNLLCCINIYLFRKDHVATASLDVV